MFLCQRTSIVHQNCSSGKEVDKLSPLLIKLIASATGDWTAYCIPCHQRHRELPLQQQKVWYREASYGHQYLNSQVLRQTQVLDVDDTIDIAHRVLVV